MRTALFTAVWLLAFAVAAAAQTVINPTRVEFAPSADHGVTLPDGTVMVERYELRHFIVGATSPVQVESLGKPAPANGVCSAPITSLPFSTSLQYVARVAAIGGTGEGVSEASNGYFFVGKPGGPASVTLKK